MQTPLYPGNGFFMNDRAFVYENYENGICVLWDMKKDETFVYGYEELKQTLKQYGLDLMKEEKENGCEI